MRSMPSTEYALLGALISGPKHGYEILQLLDNALNGAWRVSTSQLYTLLRRLEKQGLLRSSKRIQDTRPTKRIFALTPAARDLFFEWLNKPVEHVRDLRIEFLAKLFFFDRLSLQGGDVLIEAQIQSLKQFKKQITIRRKKETDPFRKLVLDFKTATVESWLGWLTHQAKPFIRKG